LQTSTPAGKNYALAIALLFALAMLWSLSYSLVKVSIETIPPVTVTAFRTFFAGLILLLIMWLKGLSIPRNRAMQGRLLLQSVLNSVIPYTFIAWAQTQVEVSIAVILSSTSPIFAFFLTWAITRHEAATARKLFGVIAGLTGICLIVGVGALAGIGKDLLAQFALLGAAFSYACAAIFGRKFDDLEPLVPAAVTLFIGSFVLVPASFILDRPWSLSPSAASFAALVALTLFSTALAYVLYFWLLRALGSIGVTSQSYLRIPMGVLFGVIFFGETLLFTTWIGLACVFVGVIAMTLPARKPQTPEA
jgi:drug/metabolite transporter (DMT)-like permease